MTVLLDDFQPQRPEPEKRKYINQLAVVYWMAWMAEIVIALGDPPMWYARFAVYVLLGIACIRARSATQNNAPQRVKRYWQWCALTTLICLGIEVMSFFIYFPNLYWEVYPILRQLIYWAGALFLLEYYSGYRTNEPFWKAMCTLVGWWTSSLILHHLMQISIVHLDWFPWPQQFLFHLVILASLFFIGWHFILKLNQQEFTRLFFSGVGLGALYLGMKSQWLTSNSSKILVLAVCILAIFPLTTLANQELKRKPLDSNK